jgi:hypothetical protein
MQRRELLALAATVGAATVAGCLGGSGGDDSAVDGQSLGESHREALAAAGRYAVTYDERGESAGSDPLTLTAELIVDETTERYLRTNTDSLGVSLSQQYVDSGQVYSYTDGGITNVESYDVAALDDATRRSIVAHLDLVTTLIETVPGRTQFQEVGTESFDGVTVTRYEAEGDSVVERSVDEVRYVMLVDGDGLVRYFERHTEDGTGDEQRIVTRSWHFHDIGTAEIREPDWVGELR